MQLPTPPSVSPSPPPLRVSANRLAEHDGSVVELTGFVDVVRAHKERVFVVLRDRSGAAQLLFDASHPEEQPPELIAAARGLSRESAVRVVGTVRVNPAVRLQGAEVLVSELDVAGPAESPLPLLPTERQRPGVETRFDWRVLDLRRPATRLVFEVQHVAEEAMRAFFAQQGLIEIHTPKLMGTASESGAEVFRVEYFGGDAYLAQSPQFYKQMAIAAGFERVFEVGPVFRAEPSYTSRHTTEFTSVDVELGWIGGVNEVMAFEESLLGFVVATVDKKLGAAIASQLGVELVVPTMPFPRLSFAEAAAIGFDGRGSPSAARLDLDSEAERRIGRFVAREFGHEFVFVTDYPAASRPFYHRQRRATDEDTVGTASYDLLWKGLEVTTGAQREHRYDVLAGQALAAGLDLAALKDYLDFFRYGCPPHGGFGLGLARVIMVMLGLSAIREATLLPRTPNRQAP